MSLNLHDVIVQPITFQVGQVALLSPAPPINGGGGGGGGTGTALAVGGGLLGLALAGLLVPLAHGPGGPVPAVAPVPIVAPVSAGPAGGAGGVAGAPAAAAGTPLVLAATPHKPAVKAVAGHRTGRGLPFTGANLWIPSVLSMGLLGLGGALWVVSHGHGAASNGPGAEAAGTAGRGDDGTPPSQDDPRSG